MWSRVKRMSHPVLRCCFKSVAPLRITLVQRFGEADRGGSCRYLGARAFRADSSTCVEVQGGSGSCVIKFTASVAAVEGGGGR